VYYTGMDPFAKKRVHVAKAMRERKMQPVLMQFSKPVDWFTVREAIINSEHEGKRLSHGARLGSNPMVEVKSI